MDRERRRRLLALALAFCAFTAAMVLRPLPAEAGQALSWAVQAATVLAAAVVMLRRARAATAGLRRARRLIALALLSGALGGVLAVGHTALTGDPPPVPSYVDAVHFGFLPLAVAGLLCYPVSSRAAGSRARVLLDGVIAAASIWFVVDVAVLQPAGVGQGLPPLAAAVTLAYPATDVLVIAMAASVLTRAAAPARRELSLLTAGLVLYAGSDIAYVALLAAGRYRADSLVGVAAEAGLLLLLAAALSHRPAPAAPPRTRAYAALPFVPAVAAIAVAAWTALRGAPLRGAPLALALVVATALVLRQLVGTRDQLALTERLRAREELFRSLVVGSADLITLHDHVGRVLYASPAVARALGLPESELDRLTLPDAVHPDDLDTVVAAGRTVLAEPGGSVEVLLRLRGAEGWRWHASRVRNLVHDPSVGGIVCNTRDVHERHLLEQQVSHDAYHDALTGLGNLARARALLHAVADSGAHATAVLVDLDGFKSVNDTYGHAQGDALLCAVADRLRDCVRADDEVVRIGGDEFLLVLTGDGTRADGDVVARRVLDALRAPVVVAGWPMSVGASLGLARSSTAVTPDELLRNADLAMYAAKAAGRGRAAWYEPHMHQSAALRMAVQRGLRRALDEGHFALHYQPIVRLPQGELAGLEALLRWQDPDGGGAGPDVFIPVAEECGLMPEIDAWVLEQACADVAAWRRAGRAVPTVSVNVSRTQLTPALPGLVTATLARHGLTGAALCVEVTESAVVPDPAAARAVLDGLRAAGVRIALDDFGTGQSSLSQLARLPVDTVKVDKSFVLDSTRDPMALRLLTSIVGVCRTLGLPVVAEGVEQAEVADDLAAAGCAYAQGWHFGRPAPADRVVLPALPALPTARGPVEDAVTA